MLQINMHANFFFTFFMCTKMVNDFPLEIDNPTRGSMITGFNPANFHEGFIFYLGPQSLFQAILF